MFDTLLVFVENSGRLLTKDELMKLIWPHTTVEEGNLSQNVFVLRKSFALAHVALPDSYSFMGQYLFRRLVSRFPRRVRQRPRS